MPTRPAYAAVRMPYELRHALRVVCAHRDETFQAFIYSAVVDRLARLDAAAAAPFIS